MTTNNRSWRRRDDLDYDDYDEDSYDDDDEEEEYFIDSVDDAQEEAEWFNDDCLQMSRNCSTYKMFVTHRLGENRALRLGRSLVGNTHVKELRVSVTSSVSMQGALALVYGIQQSEIESFTLSFTDETERPSSEVVKILYTEPMKSVSNMEFGFGITVNDAIQLRQSLRMPGSQSLKSVGFHHQTLTLQGAQEWAKVIRSSHITKLGIRGEPADHTGDILDTIFMDGVLRSRIRDISLSEAIGNIDTLTNILLSQLRSLTILKVKLSLDQVHALGDSLSQPSQLEHLILDECNLGNEHIDILSIGLHVNHRIKTLVARNNRIGDSGIISFVENWSDDSFIEKMDFENNKIGAVGAQRLMQASSTRLALKQLNLSKNEAIGYSTLRMIGDALRNNSSLTELFLDQVADTVYFSRDDERAQAQKVKVDQAAQALLDGVRFNVHLQVLSVKCNHLPLMDEIDYCLRLNKKDLRNI